MRNYVVWCVVLLAIAGTACSKGSKPSEVSWPQGVPKELTVDLGGGVKMEFVLIPAGSFMMGDEKGMGWEMPVHKVTITKPFYLGKYEVTQEQWEAVMGNNPSFFTGRTQSPVEQVSWDDCQTFLKNLNEKLGSSGAKFSLPTEAQWEYACRAGTTTRWSFGDDPGKLGEYAWYYGNAKGTFRTRRTHHPVGQKKPNAWGLYDMHGNVSEWCVDCWDGEYYAKSPEDDPVGPDPGSHAFTFRARRGGSFYDTPSRYSEDRFRCGRRRYNGSSEFRSSSLGFRVAGTLTP